MAAYVLGYYSAGDVRVKLHGAVDGKRQTVKGKLQTVDRENSAFGAATRVRTGAEEGMGNVDAGKPSRSTQ